MCCLLGFVVVVLRWLGTRFVVPSIRSIVVVVMSRRHSLPKKESGTRLYVGVLSVVFLAASTERPAVVVCRQTVDSRTPPLVL